MNTRKHLHSKEPYSAWTETKTRLVIIFPPQGLPRRFNVVTRVKGEALIWPPASEPTPNRPVRRSVDSTSRRFQRRDLPVQVLLPRVKVSSAQLPADVKILRSVSFEGTGSSFSCMRSLCYLSQRSLFRTLKIPPTLQKLGRELMENLRMI